MADCHGQDLVRVTKCTFPMELTNSPKPQGNKLP